jgi:hypothetical protein
MKDFDSRFSRLLDELDDEQRQSQGALEEQRSETDRSSRASSASATTNRPNSL